ncbi:unnamed protein product [Arabis nemorensis]|uniref:Uncharacterized protein n=1 Tax=Arabis nemorensis TaxID=586526 RepID=A0A565C9P6_9BRAS|nr:unnamed protein product [Arabis nemorensis]
MVCCVVVAKRNTAFPRGGYLLFRSDTCFKSTRFKKIRSEHNTRSNQTRVIPAQIFRVPSSGESGTDLVETSSRWIFSTSASLL